MVSPQLNKGLVFKDPIAKVKIIFSY